MIPIEHHHHGSSIINKREEQGSFTAKGHQYNQQHHCHHLHNHAASAGLIGGEQDRHSPPEVVQRLRAPAPHAPQLAKVKKHHNYNNDGTLGKKSLSNPPENHLWSRPRRRAGATFGRDGGARGDGLLAIVTVLPSPSPLHPTDWWRRPPSPLKWYMRPLWDGVSAGLNENCTEFPSPERRVPEEGGALERHISLASSYEEPVRALLQHDVVNCVVYHCWLILS